MYIFFTLLILNYFPKEFQQLRKKAIRSSLLKALSNNIPEPIISPSKPFITDSFSGIALHPIFGVNALELKGFAISKNISHLAVIVDRDTEFGNLILNDHSFFFGHKNLTVSLTEKFADDGEVALFNITMIDPLSAFYNFDLKLSSLQGKCKTHFGKELGARCETTLDSNWDKKYKIPKESIIDEFPTEIQNNVKLFGGVSANSYASAVLQKRGATIQLQIDGSVDALIGAGFHIDGVNSSGKIPINQEYIIGDPVEKILGEGKVTIFKVPISLKVTFVSNITAKNISFHIPPNINYIDIIRTVSVHLKKGITISSKHIKNTDFEKVVKVEKVKTDAVELGDFMEEESLIANFTGSFIVKIGIKAELILASITKFTVELGPEIGLDLNLNVSTEKCTFPALYGSFAPYMNGYTEFSGSFIVAGIKLFEAKKAIYNTIYAKEVVNSCLFDVSSSSELDKALLESPIRKRSIVQIINPIVTNVSNLYDPNYQPIGIFGDPRGKKASFIGFATLYFGKTPVLKENEHIFIQEQSDFEDIKLKVFPNLDENQIYCGYPFDVAVFNTTGVNFILIRNESQPILMGNQFNYTNYTEYKNFRRKFMTSDSQRIGLILYTKEDGYFCDPSKYYFIDEIYDEESDFVTNWFKITISKVIQTQKLRNIYVNFFLPYEPENQELFIYHSMQLFNQKNKLNVPMVSEYEDVFLLLKKPIKPRLNQVLMYFNVTLKDGTVLGAQNITYEDVISESFKKRASDIEFTFNSNSNVEEIEYILQLEDSYIKDLKKTPNVELKGIVTKIFVNENNENIEFFTGQPLTLNCPMENNELYGTIFFYFKDPGYIIEKNNKLYAFIKLVGAQPLLKGSRNVDEKEDLYVIKLELNKNVYYDDQKNLFLSLPFRRRTKVNDVVNAVLYCIYQSYENNTDDSPFCNDFPGFKLITNQNYYVGCIRTYTNKNDLYINEWDHFPDALSKHLITTDYPIDPPKNDGPFVRLHSIKYDSNTQGTSKMVQIVAKQKYFKFPDESHTMIIEDDTIEKFKNYARDVPLEILCSRCSDIYMNEISSNSKLFPEQTNYFTTSLKNITSGFLLEAFCKKQENAYCIFEYDLSNDGETLVEFVESSNKKSIASKQALDDKIIPEKYPGVEEIYNATKDTTSTAKYRININCNRQVIPSRKGKFYLNKPWEGSIKKIATHLEKKEILIEVRETIKNNFIFIELVGKGFKYFNPSISDEQRIPFNPNFFAESESRFKELLSQIGILIDKRTREEIVTNNEIEVNDDGLLVAKYSFFDEKKLNESITNNKIDLIPISKYKLSDYVPPKNEDPEENDDGDDKTSCKGSNNNNLNLNLPPRLGPLSLGNFDINSVYVGGSKVTNFLLGYINELFPSFYYLHTAVWVGESDATDETEGIIFVYGKYNSSDPIYLFGDGARSYVMKLGKFKKTFNAFKVQKVIPHRNLKLFDFIDKLKKSRKWNVRNYNMLFLNCQHFTADCLNILEAKRMSPNEIEWKLFPRRIVKTLKHNEYV